MHSTCDRLVIYICEFFKCLLFFFFYIILKFNILIIIICVGLFKEFICVGFQIIFFMFVRNTLECYYKGKTWGLGEVNKCYVFFFKSKNQEI